jgi:hypothetical protein
MRDAAVGPDVLGRAGQQEEQRAPRVRAGAGVERDRANEVAVKQPGELGDRQVRLWRARTIDEQLVGVNLERKRPAMGQPRRGLGEPRQRLPDGRMPVWIERDRACRRLARSREIGQACGDVGGEKGVRGDGRNSNKSNL